MKTVTLKDGGVEKTFLITPHKAIPALQLALSIAKLFSSEGVINRRNIEALINNRLFTGVEGDDSLPEMNVYDLVALSIKSILANIDEDDIEKFLNRFLSNVCFQNGTLMMSVTDDMDNCISDMATIIELVKEVFMVNFGSLFAEKKTDS